MWEAHADDQSGSLRFNVDNDTAIIIEFKPYAAFRNRCMVASMFSSTCLSNSEPCYLDYTTLDAQCVLAEHLSITLNRVELR